MRHIHLQPLGGAAGDMFVACLLDAFPEHAPAVTAAAAQASGVACRITPHRDAVFTGSRFTVAGRPAHHADHHGHVHWHTLRSRLQASDLPPPVREHALGIFTVLAEAEARVHGLDPQQVTFHEVGAVDSLADIAAAAAVLAALGPAQWTVDSLPLGGGTVETAHGTMPVPTPATALLLQGFALHDDGLPGERVTPTGAAILRYLGCAARRPLAGTLQRSGNGFGTRQLHGRSNCLRALVFEQTCPGLPGHRELGVITFEVDDQSPEDLAIGLDRLRNAPGVHDVVQFACLTKKSRFAVHVQVLTKPENLHQITEVCFRETTTIGLRTHIVHGQALPRQVTQIDHAGLSLSVKLVERPGPEGATRVTAKAEADHVQRIDGHDARQRVRRAAEHLALDRASATAHDGAPE